MSSRSVVRVLITGAGSVMGQSIYRALAQHDFGVPVEVHFGNSDEFGAGRYLSAPGAPIAARPILPLAADPGFLAAIDAYVDAERIDIVFPGTQHELLQLAELHDRTANAATLSLALTRLALDKYALVERLAAAGIAVPETRRLSEFRPGPGTSGPIVVKPLSSSGSRSIFRLSAGDDTRFASVLGEIGPANLDRFVVQQALEGDEFTCGCYRDRYTGELSVIVLRRTLTADGATAFGEVVAYPGIEAYLRSIAAALVDQGFDYGHLNVQLIDTAQGPLLFEINGRLSSTEAPKAALGFNSCAAFVDNVVFQRPATLGPVQIGKRFLRYYEEVYF